MVSKLGDKSISDFTIFQLVRVKPFDTSQGFASTPQLNFQQGNDKMVIAVYVGTSSYFHIDQ